MFKIKLMLARVPITIIENKLLEKGHPIPLFCIRRVYYISRTHALMQFKGKGWWEFHGSDDKVDRILSILKKEKITHCKIQELGKEDYRIVWSKLKRMQIE